MSAPDPRIEHVSELVGGLTSRLNRLVAMRLLAELYYFDAEELGEAFGCSKRTASRLLRETRTTPELSTSADLLIDKVREERRRAAGR